VLALQRMLGHQSAKVTLDTYADLFDDEIGYHARHHIKITTATVNAQNLTVSTCRCVNSQVPHHVSGNLEFSCSKAAFDNLSRYVKQFGGHQPKNRGFQPWPANRSYPLHQCPLRRAYSWKTTGLEGE
jgi:hypothetical protein